MSASGPPLTNKLLPLDKPRASAPPQLSLHNKGNTINALPPPIAHVRNTGMAQTNTSSPLAGTQQAAGGATNSLVNAVENAQRSTAALTSLGNASAVAMAANKWKKKAEVGSDSPKISKRQLLLEEQQDRERKATNMVHSYVMGNFRNDARRRSIRQVAAILKKGIVGKSKYARTVDNNVFVPEQLIVLMWNVIVHSLVMFQAIWIPLEMAWKMNHPMNQVFDIVFLCDVCMQFNIAYERYEWCYCDTNID